MRLLARIHRYSRLASRLREAYRPRLTLEQASALVGRRVEEREANFLRMLERDVFGYPQSPYLALMKLAGCELEDLRATVRSKGLEETLVALRRAGVYIAYEEFKGLQPIVRGGREIPAKRGDFANPHASRDFLGTSSGSTGPATVTWTNLDYLAAQSPPLMLAYHAHGMLGLPMVSWRGMLPDASGIGITLRLAQFGWYHKRWFSIQTRQDWKPTFKMRYATDAIVLLGRLAGAPLPRPEPVSLDQAGVVARCVAEIIRAEGACVVFATIALSMRVCLAAREEGLDLTGATFTGGGEPPTPAKVREVARVGARWVPSYAFTEGGYVGIGCVQPVDGNDIHVFKDLWALIQYPRLVPGTDIAVDAFCFTALQPTASWVLLNVEVDDYGVIERRSCGCPLESYGFTDHVREIRSFQKLTGESTTLVGSSMVRILEEVLPARFGGTPLDYQIMEEEDEQGFTRLSLLVNPKIDLPDDAEVVNTVLNSLGGWTKVLWRQAQTLRVKRMEPIWTARGKLSPLHLSQRGRPHAGKERPS